MIIGKGLIASAFNNVDRENVIFFASGVSNSLEADPSQFKREENLVLETIHKYPSKYFIYFSTCSIYDSSKYNSPYVLHKLHMEEIIKTLCKTFLILRISNAVGRGGNPNLLMNYLSSTIRKNQPITVYKNAARNLIGIDDVRRITIQLIDNEVIKNKIINIAYTQNFSILEIIEEFEVFYGIVVPKNIREQGQSYSIDITEIESYFALNSTTEYLKQLIHLYY